MAWLYESHLWILWAVPIVIALSLYAAWRRRALQIRFGDIALVRRLSKSVSGRRRRYKASIMVTAVALLSLALAGPQVGTQLREIKREGIDLVIALDVSASMLAEDVAPNRLGRARNEIKRLLSELRGDRVGLVIFAGDAFIQCPLTTDYSAVRLFLDVANPDLLPTPGTDFGAAMQMAIQAFDAPSATIDSEATLSKALLIVSDGENHVAELDEILATARDEGITVFTAGVGDMDGAPIPVYNATGQRTGYKRDLEGQIVHSRLEEAGLKALSADGAYFQVARTSSSLSQLIPALEGLHQVGFAEEEFEDYDLKYQWPLALALLLLCVDGLVTVRRSPVKKQEI
ncbi:MAG: VWA domain-containing protein [Rhodothermaceae bacterium]|nr:VWA domain-containing protein [Bacteroidota bacterium]MXW33268.1 VWA domain-containing protein [Rhodothermaceae bacterium]MXX96003.1 VWA domain-containing protein [Rhodothermaceae bacterium]MXZ58072.1 VWA domain-containing protein [Rhodothermaceae bacterium]MYB91552.1 VWA domain-containing protein [Rhodothermaceae bacterium]